MDIDDVIQKKKEWKKKGILIEFCSLLKHNKVPKTHPFCKMKVQTSRNKEHTCLFFLIEKSKLTHQHSFICKIVQEANLKKKEKKKDDISSVPPVRKLVIKTQQWHILYIVLSPLTLYWVLQGDQKHRKSSCTKDNANKAKGLYAPFSHRTAEPSCARLLTNVSAQIRAQNVNKTQSTAQPGRCGVEKIPNKHNKRRDAFHEKRFS